MMDLTGQLLIAMPGMSDPRFARSVVFICGYSDEGAMGLILNKPAGDMTLGEVYKRLDISGTSGPSATPVYIGGPVETERGFVLHRDQNRLAPDAEAICGEYVLTATKDILEDLSNGLGPVPFKFALGYAGWAAGQLEAEIAQNGWLTAQTPENFIYGTAPDQMWDTAVRSIGIDPVTLSGAAGRA